LISATLPAPRRHAGGREPELSPSGNEFNSLFKLSFDHIKVLIVNFRSSQIEPLGKNMLLTPHRTTAPRAPWSARSRRQLGASSSEGRTCRARFIVFMAASRSEVPCTNTPTRSQLAVPVRQVTLPNHRAVCTARQEGTVQPVRTVYSCCSVWCSDCRKCNALCTTACASVFSFNCRRTDGEHARSRRRRETAS
jgi:hypothetical protein